MFEDNKIYTLILPAGRYIDDNGAPAIIENDYTVSFKVDLFVLENFETYKVAEEGSAQKYPWAMISYKIRGGK